MLLKWLKNPDLASLHGGVVDSMNEFVHWFMLILFVFWTAFLAYVFWRFRRKKNPKADYLGNRSHFSTHLEIGVVIIEIILLVGFAFPFWFQRASSFPTGSHVVRVRAVAMQFNWMFHYPGPDGKFGRVHHDFYPTNPVGLDPADPNGFDDIVQPSVLTAPINRPVVIQVTSKDVIHGLAIHATRTSQDAIPGMEIPTWFTATQIGKWDIICAQLCGAGHGVMQGTFTTIPEEDWDKWVKDNAPKVPAAPAAPAAAPAAPAAAPAAPAATPVR